MLKALVFVLGLFVLVGCHHAMATANMPSLGDAGLSDEQIQRLSPGTAVSVRTKHAVLEAEYHGQADSTILLIRGEGRNDIAKVDIVEVRAIPGLRPAAEVARRKSKRHIAGGILAAAGLVPLGFGIGGVASGAMQREGGFIDTRGFAIAAGTIGIGVGTILIVVGLSLVATD